MEELMNDIRYYIDLRIKRIKLHLIGSMSTVVSKAISFVVFILFMLIALLLFTGALVLLVDKWVDSMLLAFVITGGFYLIVGLVFLALKDRMFSGMMVKTFSKMFFTKKSEDDEEDEYEED